MADDDLLDQYLAKDKAGPAAAAPSAGEPDGLDSYLRADQAATAASGTAAAHSAAPIVSPHPGILANDPTENPALGLAKDAGTGAVRGVGDMAGVVGNTGNLADYLVARGESLFTHQPPDEIMADMQAKRQAQDAAWASSQNPLERVLSAINPRNVFPTGAQVAAPLLAATGEHVPTSEPGRIAQGAAETVTGALGPGVIGAPAAVPGLIGQTLARAPVTAASGAVGTGIADATKDPLLGLLATGAPALAMKGMAGLAGKIVGQVDPATAQLADTARHQFGIPVTAPQISDSPALRFGASALGRLPFSGAGADAAHQQTAFNRAVSNTFGEDAEAITPHVMQSAKARIGSAFDTVAQNTTIRPDQQFVADLTKTMGDAQTVLPPAEIGPLRAQIGNIADTIQQNNGVLPGASYQALTRKGAPLDRAMNSSDPNVAFYAGQIRNALDDTMSRSASPEMQQMLSTAKLQYKNMKTIEDLVEKSPTGHISPALLLNQVRNSYGNMAYNGGGAIGDLARIGQRFLKEPPSSGTAERLGAMGLLSRVGGLGAAAVGAQQLAGTSPIGAVGGLAGLGASLGAGRAIGAGLRSDALANALINRSLGRNMAPSFAQELANRLMLPYAPHIGAQIGAPAAAKSP